MAGRRHQRSDGLRLAAAAGASWTALLLMACLAPAATAKPTLLLPQVAAQGQTAAVVINPRGSRACRLLARTRGNRSQSRRVPARRARIAYLSIARRARVGAWTLRLRCSSGTSAAKRLRVKGLRQRAGRALFGRLQTRRPGGQRPDGYTDPRSRQNEADGPGIGLRPPETSGRGGNDGGRVDRALAWALGQQGALQYNGWCLRFVAHAFGQESFPATATLAANQLGPRDGNRSFLSAPRGSLVWFTWGNADLGRNVGHVGIALGDGRMVHALDMVRVVQIEGSRFWRSRYRGWTPAPAEWPGRPGPAPPLPVEDPVVVPPPPLRKIITVDNRVTNGPTMREDATPLRLTTQPRTRCGSLGCNINGTERRTGGTYDAAECQTTGERFTNGHDASADDDANPELFESTRYYGVRLANNTFGYVSEVWIRAADRGGLGLPRCP